MDRNVSHIIQWESAATTNTGMKEIYPFGPTVSIDLFKRETTLSWCYPCTVGMDCPPCGSGTSSVFVRHLAIANLFDNSWTYDPSAMGDVPNGSDYVIRISMGQVIWVDQTTTVSSTSVDMVIPTDSIKISQTPIGSSPVGVDQSMVWDESDSTFTITGGSVCPPNTCPLCPAYPDLSAILGLLSQVAAELNRAIELLKLNALTR